MKRYVVSLAREVNTAASKSGIMFQYSGRTDRPDSIIEWYELNECVRGIRITDSTTEEIVFENLRG